jgi:cytochrome c-type biogenesis protein
VIEVPAALQGALASGGVMALPIALAAGLFAGIHPCFLALYPAAATTCCGEQEVGQSPRAALPRVLPRALAFIAGVALATSMLGVLAAAAGRLTGGLGHSLRYAVAFVPLLMGLHLLGWLRLPLGKLTPRSFHPGMGGALGAGFTLALVVAPCSTPVLASVLSYAAYKGSLFYGGALLFVYGIGAGTPVLLAGTASGTLARRLEVLGGRRWLNEALGIFQICLGLYLLWTA